MRTRREDAIRLGLAIRGHSEMGPPVPRSVCTIDGRRMEWIIARLEPPQRVNYWPMGERDDA